MHKFFVEASPTRMLMTTFEKSLSAARIFSGIRTITVIFNFALAFLIILHAAVFSDRAVYCLGFLAPKFNSEIVQRLKF